MLDAHSRPQKDSQAFLLNPFGSAADGLGSSGFILLPHVGVIFFLLQAYDLRIGHRHDLDEVREVFRGEPAHSRRRTTDKEPDRSGKFQAARSLYDNAVFFVIPCGKKASSSPCMTRTIDASNGSA